MRLDEPATSAAGTCATRAFGPEAPNAGGERSLRIGGGLGFLFAAILALSGCVQSRPAGIAACGPYYYGYDATTHAVGNRPLGGGASTADWSSVIAGNKVQHSFVASGFSASEDNIARLTDAIAAIGKEADAGSHPRRLNILALSGGGQWGAYGAGLLTGWSQRDAKLPKRGRPVS